MCWLEGQSVLISSIEQKIHSHADIKAKVLSVCLSNSQHTCDMDQIIADLLIDIVKTKA